MPILFILLAMTVIKLSPNEKEPPALILHPWYWDKPNYIFRSLSNNINAPLSKSIDETWTQTPSLGTRCMQSTMLNKKLYPCAASNTGYVEKPISAEISQALNAVNYNRTRRSPDCDCWEKLQTCPVGAGGPPPSFDILETKDVLYRLSNYNLTDW
jgi:hypothetical protein